ncbi:hypothetical protein RJ640_015574 [Escallonia rubra]|uniref:RRM domain-containing protein n=1 Tax=Escallonia rubra TaxID=112253 RepID=A0AA88RCV7_9ASTE|nr:hypothetical protein RJ640_015574 [Escallonia rubra]
MANRLGTQLFVSRLSFYTNTQELKKWFSPYGVVKEARIIRDSKTLRPKGYAFIRFESEVEAQKAMKAMNGRIVNGKLIFVEVAKTETPAEDAKTTRTIEDSPSGK